MTTNTYTDITETLGYKISVYGEEAVMTLLEQEGCLRDNPNLIGERIGHETPEAKALQASGRDILIKHKETGEVITSIEVKTDTNDVPSIYLEIENNFYHGGKEAGYLYKDNPAPWFAYYKVNCTRRYDYKSKTYVYDESIKNKYNNKIFVFSLSALKHIDEKYKLPETYKDRREWTEVSHYKYLNFDTLEKAMKDAERDNISLDIQIFDSNGLHKYLINNEKHKEVTTDER